MLSLLKAFLLAPAIVSAFVLPPSSKHVDADFKQKQNDIDTSDAYTMGFVRLDIRHGSSADISPLDLRVDILHSTEACGFANVTIDGQALSQTFDSKTLVSSGKGSISTSTNKIVVGSWSFDCILIDGKPHGQLMKFMIDFVDGKAIDNSGFSLLFRQTDETEIMKIETISSEKDQVIKHHSPKGQSSDKKHHNEKGQSSDKKQGQSSNKKHHNGKGHKEELEHSMGEGEEREHVHHMSEGEEREHVHHMSEGEEKEHVHHMSKGPGEHVHHMGDKEFNLHKELAEFRYMKAQLKELKYLIHKKKRHIAKHTKQDNNLDDGIKDCDSLRCVAGVIREKARKFYGKIAGDGLDKEYFKHARKEQSKQGKKEFDGKLGKKEFDGKPGKKEFDGKPGNHTSGNHTRPDGPHHYDNRTGPHFPPPNPHHLLPICHYPPPRGFHPHGDGPNGPPHEPPHGPPPHEFGPQGLENEKHHGMHPFHDDKEESKPWEGRPRHHDGHHGKPHGDEFDEEIERQHRGSDGSRHKHEDFEEESENHHGKHAKPHHEALEELESHHGKHAKPHHEGPPSFDGPESNRFEEHHHGKPLHEESFDGPEHEHDGPHHPHERPFDGPEHEGPHHQHDEEFHHGPSHEDFEDQESKFDGPAPHDSPFHQGPPQDHPNFNKPPSHDGSHAPTDHFDGPPPGSHFDGPPPHMAEDEHSPSPHGPPPHAFPFHILKFGIIGFLFSIIIIALYKRTCNPQARSARQALREQRLGLRRARAGMGGVFKAWWMRVTGRDEELEEKDGLLEDCDDDASVAGDLNELRNAADVVGDMVAAEEGRSLSSPLNASPFANESPVFDMFTEELPAYEDNDHDGSEASSLVADGFRYTPGCSEYSPARSASGSVSDVLGDKK